MTTDQLTAYLAAAKAAKGRADKATPGPWWRTDPPWGMSDAVHAGPSDDPHTAKAHVCISATFIPIEVNEDIDEAADMGFIAAARTDIPTLADAVVALAAEVERLQNELRVAEQTIADFYETGDSP